MIVGKGLDVNMYNPIRNFPRFFYNARMRKSEVIRDKLRKRILELNLKYGSISKKLGKNHAYIHQYITRGVPEELPYEIRLPLAQLLGWSEKDLRVNEITMPFGNSGAEYNDGMEEKKGSRYISAGKKGLEPKGTADPDLVFEATQITNNLAREHGLSAAKIKNISLDAAEIASERKSSVTRNLILYLIEISKDK